MNKKILLVSTGGTIASRFDPALGRVVASRTGEELVASLGGTGQLPALEIDQLSTIASFDFSVDDALRIAQRVTSACAREDVSGVVVTQGTDTLEETSFLAALVVPVGKPVIFTGAQLAADDPQSDGPRNLRNAILVAASDSVAELGAVVVFNGEIHGARNVQKTHSSALETFQSPGYGPVGVIDRGRVLVRHRPPPSRRFQVEKLDKRVDLIKVFLGMDATMLEACVAAGAAGVVLEGSGRGHVTPGLAPVVHRLAKGGFPVVMTSRCAGGRVEAIYGSKHQTGGKDLQDSGVIFAGDLRGLKARMLLMAALADPTTRGNLREVFAEMAP